MTSHKDKYRSGMSDTKITKERWDEIFGGGGDAGLRDPSGCRHSMVLVSGGVRSCMECGTELGVGSKLEFEGDFTGGGLMGKNRREY